MPDDGLEEFHSDSLPMVRLKQPDDLKWRPRKKGRSKPAPCFFSLPEFNQKWSMLMPRQDSAPPVVYIRQD